MRSDDDGSDAVVATATIREAAGIFRSREALEVTIDELLVSGFERSDVDIMGDIDAVRSMLGSVFLPVEEIADQPNVPRRALVTRDDQELTTIGAFQTLFTVGAFAAAMTIVATGGTFALALAGAAAAGTLSGTLGAAIANAIGKKHSDEIEDALQSGGIVLWVRVRTPELEERALEILRRHGAEGVRVHEIEIDKRLEDLPLADIHPDPLLERHPNY